MHFPSDNELDFIRRHRDDDPADLVLHAGRCPGIDVPFCAGQIGLRKKIRTKIPSWYREERLVYPHGLSVEQCSSEATARYKAGLLPAGCTVADLTGGLGVDSAFLAERAACVHYFERQEELCEAARHNFGCLGLGDRIRVCCTELAETELPDRIPAGVQWCYLDPARRGGGGERVYDVTGCEPDLTRWKGPLLARAEGILAKLSPMMDLSRAAALLPETVRIDIVSVGNEVKELLFLLRRRNAVETAPDTPEDRADLPVHCVSLRPEDGLPRWEFVFSQREERECPAPPYLTAAALLQRLDSGTPLRLLDPDKALLKGGAFKTLAARYGLTACSVHAHLYLLPDISGVGSDTAASAGTDGPAPAGIPAGSGWPGRLFRILTVLPFDKRARATVRQHCPDGRANVTARHFPLSSDALRERLGLTNGDRCHIFGVTLQDGRRVLMLTRPV